MGLGSLRPYCLLGAIHPMGVPDRGTTDVPSFQHDKNPISHENPTAAAQTPPQKNHGEKGGFLFWSHAPKPKTYPNGTTVGIKQNRFLSGSYRASSICSLHPIGVGVGVGVGVKAR